MLRQLIIVFVLVTLSGCVSFNIDKSLSDATLEINDFATSDLQLQRTPEQLTDAREKADQLLSAPLGQSSAVELALINSPAVQAMLAAHWEQAANTAMSGSIPNPVFEFGRLSNDEELEIERVLSVGLLDLLRFPMLYRSAKLQLQVDQTLLVSNVVDKITEVRQAWVNAITAKQLESYAEQIFSSAEASAVLAANMQAVGNFSALSRAEQQAYYADAATNLTVARHQSLAAREALVRLLGLSDEQSAKLILPERLPELPEAPLAADIVTSTALENRLDVKMAMAGLRKATTMQGLRWMGEITDIELAGISESVWKEGESESIDGYEIGLELPLFRGIRQQRNQLNARSLSASNNLESVTRSAISYLREAYSAYRSTFDIARHFRDEVVPLQQMVSEENVLNYNGMLIGVFELLADSRDQIETVQASIEATAQFWTADAALRASMMGKPMASQVTMTTPSGGDDDGGGH